MEASFAPHTLIDGHVHLSLTRTQSWAGNAAQLEEMRRTLGIKAFCVQNIVIWDTRHLVRNPVSLLLKRQCHATMYSFGGIRYPQPHSAAQPYSYAQQAQRLIAMGFDGIKLFAKPDVRRAFGQPLDSPVFDEMFSWLEESGTSVLYHIADPPEFWDAEKVPAFAKEAGWLYGEDTPSFDGILDELDRLMAKHPRLRVVLPHFLFLSQDLPRCDAFLARWPNARLDITPGVELYHSLAADIGAAHAFFEKHQDRIHFGTDNVGTPYDAPNDGTWLKSAQEKVVSIRTFLEKTEGEVFGRQQPCLGLDGTLLDKIYATNYLNFTAPAPKPVDTEAALAYTSELLQEAEIAGDSPNAVAILQDVLKAMAG